MRRGPQTLALAVLSLATLFTACTHASANATATRGLGRPADPADIVREDIDVAPDGTGLPAGRGDAVDGAAIYATSCRSCHGVAIRLDPQRWPYATTLFHYVRRAMPPPPAARLDAHGVYSIVAYELYLNGLARQDELFDATRLPRLRMPRVDDFVEQP